MRYHSVAFPQGELGQAELARWFAAQLHDETSRYYNQCIIVPLVGALHEEALQAALIQIIGSRAGEALAETMEPPFHYPTTDLFAASLPECEAELNALVAWEARAAFDLADGPLIRGRLVRLAPDSHVLILTLHPLICDDWPAATVVADFTQCYIALCNDAITPSLPFLPSMPPADLRRATQPGLR